MKKLKIFIQLLIIVLSTSLFASENKITFLDGRFEIIQPGDWELMNNLNENATLQMGNPAKEAYMIIISEPAIAFKPGYTVKNHSQITRDAIIKNSQDGMLVSGPGNIKINGMDGVQCEISAKFENTDILYTHISFRSSKHFHQVLFWSTKDQYDSNKTVFQKALNSITELKMQDKKIKFLGDEYEILQPGDWGLMNDLNDQAELQMGDPSSEAYMVIISEPLSDFEEGFTIQSHSDITRKTLMDGIQNGKIISGPKKIKINGMDGLAYEINGTIQNLDIVYYHLTLKSSKHYHQVLAWTLAKNYKVNKAVFESITKSIRQL